jgi:ATP-dependent Clp endopeptidase proteolytic subunit ClpP
MQESEKLLEDNQIVIINNIDPQPKEDEIRTLSIYGDIEESKCSDIVNVLMYLKDNALVPVLTDPEDPESEVVISSRPINMIVSTYGGSSAEMFSVYDTMRLVKETCDINTVGLGKVMSAGVLLLAAGTKGKRKIGANCRVMIHNVMGGSHGMLSNLENDIEEIKWSQGNYIKCLAAETKLTQARLKKMLRRNMDVYLSAEQAVEFGIADEII